MALAFHFYHHPHLDEFWIKVRRDPPLAVTACRRIWGSALVNMPDGLTPFAGIEVTGVIALIVSLSCRVAFPG
jgi:hypothetical protein